VGKTTVFLKISERIRNQGFSVGGMFTSEIVREKQRIGFSIVDIQTGQTGELASLRFSTGPRLGKYVVNLRDLVEIGVRAVDRAIENSDLIGIDEIGPMELLSRDFKEVAQKATGSHKPVLATIHFRARNSVLEYVRNHPDSKMTEVTTENREGLPTFLTNEIVEVLRILK
jgi:nucleoside-triphosphatase